MTTTSHPQGSADGDDYYSVAAITARVTAHWEARKRAVVCACNRIIALVCAGRRSRLTCPCKCHVVPRRVQLRRTKGWRKPAGAVVVSRPSKWGNPWRAGELDVDGKTPMSPARAVERYRTHLALGNLTRSEIAELRGRDLLCWCKPGTPCHADILLEVANS